MAAFQFFKRPYSNLLSSRNSRDHGFSGWKGTPVHIFGGPDRCELRCSGNRFNIHSQPKYLLRADVAKAHTKQLHSTFMAPAPYSWWECPGTVGIEFAEIAQCLPGHRSTLVEKLNLSFFRLGGFAEVSCAIRFANSEETQYRRNRAPRTFPLQCW